VLRDPAEAALNAVLAACVAAAEEHANAAAMLDDDTDADMLRLVERRRRAAAAELRHMVRNQGDLPRTAHHERELVREGVTRVKAMLAGDRRRAIMGDQAEAERRLVEACTAMPEDAAEEHLALIATLREDAVATEQAFRSLAAD
jgi:hypothetical protein